MRLLAATGDFNGLAVGVFGVVLAMHARHHALGRQAHQDDTEFYAAGRGMSRRRRTASPPPATTCPRRPSSATRA